MVPGTHATSRDCSAKAGDTLLSGLRTLHPEQNRPRHVTRGRALPASSRSPPRRPPQMATAVGNPQGQPTNQEVGWFQGHF